MKNKIICFVGIDTCDKGIDTTRNKYQIQDNGIKCHCGGMHKRASPLFINC